MNQPHQPDDWWARVSESLEHVVSLPLDARPGALSALGVQDPALRDEVMSLLEAHVAEAGRFEASALAGHRVDASPESVLPAGTQLGPYRIVREIGRGGMGSVFEAYRVDDDYRKRVAIKTITNDLGHPGLHRRFRRERRILARLEHRNIATLLDGGMLPDGAPYFAMEFAEGQPIDAYCESHQLPTRDRLQLMRQVCGAVQFAHRNLVVHRDLKPGNIVVTADGTVKLLDFGVAKLLASDDDSSEPEQDLTGIAAGPYTLAYASPEQVRGEPITTTSDVYALGVVLYKVVTQRHPFRAADTTPSELRRRILEEPVPSTGLGQDLDAIIATAMNKDAARRYTSAEQFSDDLRRLMDGLPVQARPDSVGYRMRMFVRRHRVSVSAFTAAIAALIVAVVISIDQARVASAERDRARVEAAKAMRVTSFVQDMLRSADPREARPDITVADALAAAALRADSSLSAEPEVLSAVQTAIGLSYLGLGRYDDAEPLLQSALTLRQQLGPDAAAQTAAGLRNLALLQSERGKLAPAESLFRASLKVYRGMVRPDSSGLGNVLNDLADLLQYKGDLAGATEANREALAIRRNVDGPKSQTVAGTLNSIAVIEGQQGHWAVAESLHREALAIVVDAHGPDHPDVAAVSNSLAFAVQAQGRVAAAESLYHDALRIREKTLGPGHPETARTHMNLGWLLHDSGRYQDAISEASAVLALRHSLGDDHPAIGSTLILHGQSLLKLGQVAEGERSLRDALRIRERTLPPGHWLIAASRSAVGEALLLRGRYDESEHMLLGALATLRKERGEDAELTRLAKTRLVTLYEKWGRPDRARQFR